MDATEVVHRFIAVINAGDVDLLGDVMTETRRRSRRP
jgi:hypothetical protein